MTFLFELNSVGDCIVIASFPTLASVFPLETKCSSFSFSLVPLCDKYMKKKGIPFKKQTHPWKF